MKFIIYLQKYIQQLFQKTLGDFQDIQAILSDPEFNLILQEVSRLFRR